MKKLLLIAILFAGCSKVQDKPVQLEAKAETETIAKRYAFDHDGNIHDLDDIPSVSMELAMASKRAVKIAAFIYNNHYWQTNSSQQTKETNSVLNSARAFGLSTTNFVSARDHHSTAVTLLKNAINASTASDSLIIIAAGPMQVLGEAMKASNSSARRYVRIITHSTWNNEHAARYGGGEGLTGTKYNMYSGYGCTPISSMGAKISKIKDQNGTVSAPYSAYTYLQNTKYQIVWDEAQIAHKPNFDDSDAGMFYYALTNDQDGSPSKIRTLLGL